MTEDKIRNALKKVIDPELGVNIVDLGLIYKINFDKGIAKISMTLTSPGCPLADVFEKLVESEVKKVVGVKKVKINLTFEPLWTPDRIKRRERIKLGL